jgi:hypothetical protein
MPTPRESQHERLFQKMAGLEIFPADSLITVGGALSTGSHGVGNRQLGSISSLVVEITMVTAAGKLVTLTAKRNPELFYAAQVSLGVLGIIASVKLSVVHIQKLRFERVQSVIAPDRLLLDLPALETKHQKHLFFWQLRRAVSRLFQPPHFRSFVLLCLVALFRAQFGSRRGDLFLRRRTAQRTARQAVLQHADTTHARERQMH